MKLLLVDDDADQLELKSLILGNAGYAVFSARNSPDALRLAKRENPEAAIVDLNLPTAEAGLRLLRDLKTMHAEIRLIVMTGADAKTRKALQERSDVEAVFAKGSGSRELVAHLKTVRH